MMQWVSRQSMRQTNLLITSRDDLKARKFESASFSRRKVNY